MRAATLCVMVTAVMLTVTSFAHADSSFQYVSPRPDAAFVSKATNLAFRAAATTTSAFPDITVSGTASRDHGGQWVFADDGRTMIFRPANPFTPGEVVSVTVTLGGASESYSFTVSPKTGAEHFVVPDGDCFDDCDVPVKQQEMPGPSATDGVAKPAGFPNFQITTNISPGAGRIFVTPSNWIAIIDNDGTFCYFSERETPTFDFKKSPSGNLTFVERNPAEPVPQVNSKGLIMDSTYTVVDEYVAGNGYATETDVHEFTQLANGNVILMIYDRQPVDMSAIFPGGDPNAVVMGLVLQELDPSHNVVFEWRSWDHFQFTDTYQDLTAGFIDYVHGNAIEVDTDGNWLVSSRNLSEVTKIDRSTGDIIWRLGGRQNQFLVNGTIFTRQHDVRRLANGHVTVYDNGNDSSPQESRAVEYELVETGTKTATVVWQYRHPDGLFSPFTGSNRRLANGNTLISWGNLARQTEVDALGNIVWESTGIVTYRAPRQTWTGAVAAAPTLWVVPDEEAMSATLHFTKFGDNNVAQYCIYWGYSPQPTTLLATTAADSFVASSLATGVNHYFRVTAKDDALNESPYSNEELVYLNPIVPVLITRFSATRSVDAVDLSWNLAADEDLAGFVLYRAESDNAPVALNPGLLGVDQRNFRDTAANPGKSYAYTLVVVLVDGSRMQSQTAVVKPVVTGLTLDQNHPNPFNPVTLISFDVPAASIVDLAVFDPSGRRVRTLSHGRVEAGRTSVAWDGRDDANRPVASGVYFYRLSDGRHVVTRKMLLLK